VTPGGEPVVPAAGLRAPTFDDATLAEARAFNRKLARLPRFGARMRWAARAMNGLLRLSQVGADGRLRRAGIDVRRMTAERDGLRVPVRVLRPADPVRAVVLDIHGGGWVIGNACMNDALNAALARACGVAVVSVDYRLLPGAPMQAALDDCLAAARWLLDGGLPGFARLPVFVVGESAGGHLAAATLQRLRAWPALLARIEGAVLYYGVYDMAGTPTVRAAGPDTLVLDGPGMAAGMASLTPGLDDVQRRQAPLSPLYGDLAGMPPALFIAGALDPLRDDSVAMARRWRDVAPVRFQLVPDAPHGMIHFPTRMAKIVTAHAHAWIRARLDRNHLNESNRCPT
jgi:acetyl esterase/lipase